MSNMNNNARGRITGMPGTETRVTLYPQRLGVRMRNSIIRMLENRIVEGGWSSQSARITRALAAKYNLQVSNQHWNGLHILGLSAHAAPLIKEVVHTDWIARLVEEPSYRNGYYKDRHIEAMAFIDEVNPDFYINMHDKGLMRKVIEILAEHTTQELKDKSKQVADMLRGTEPIEIITFQE